MLPRVLVVGPLVLLAARLTLAQSDPPLYLDHRLGEDQAVVDVAEMTGNYPRKAVQEYEQALEDARKGDRVSALARLEEVVMLAPEYYAAHNSLGVLYQKMKRYRDAERVYQQARALNPRSAAPLVNLGSLYIEEAEASGNAGRVRARSLLNEALGHLQEALKIQPSSGFAHYLVGVVYYITAFYEEAESHFSQALDSGRNMGFVRQALANVYIQLQEWEGVIEQLDSYLKENPQAVNRDHVREVRDRAARQLQTATP